MRDKSRKGRILHRVGAVETASDEGRQRQLDKLQKLVAQYPEDTQELLRDLNAATEPLQRDDISNEDVRARILAVLQ